MSVRLENEENLILVMNQYYSEIEKGETNRAEEFVKNFGQGDYQAGLYYLTNQANDHNSFMETHNYFNLQNENIQARKKLVANFILNLEYKRNEFYKYIEYEDDVAEEMEWNE